MPKEIIIAENHQYEIASVPEMTAMAKQLKDHVVKQRLFSEIQGKNYVHADGWAYAGGMMGVIPKVVKLENLSNGAEKKWRADVELIRLKDNAIIGFGSALCSSSEGRKKGFDEYAILSMAQTRA